MHRNIGIILGVAALSLAGPTFAERPQAFETDVPIVLRLLPVLTAPLPA